MQSGVDGILGIDAVQKTAPNSSFDFGNIFLYIIIFAVIYSFIYAYWVITQNIKIRNMKKNGVLLEIVLEKDTETNHLSVEQMWAAFYNGLYIPWYRRLFKPQPHMTFEIKSENTEAKSKKEITFNFWVLEEYKGMMKQRLLSLYPKAQISEVTKDYMPNLDDPMRIVEIQQYGLKEDNAFSLKIFKDFEADPLTSITSAMSELDNTEVAVVQMIIRPTDPRWRSKAEAVLHRYERTGKKPKKIIKSM